MIRYEVRLDVDPALAESIEVYMETKHIPEMMALGCFLRAHFNRGEAGVYRTTYLAARREDLDRYLREHAEALRADFLRHFPKGVTSTREVWTQLGEWGMT
ncbi:MAG: DUF4286 family protein [Gemmatimonadales bacterium]